MKHFFKIDKIRKISVVIDGSLSLLYIKYMSSIHIYKRFGVKSRVLSKDIDGIQNPTSSTIPGAKLVGVVSLR